jgi:flagellar biogenesis protein FliO
MGPNSQPRPLAYPGQSLLVALARILRGIGRRVLAPLRSGNASPELRLRESVSLGDKRFVAVIEVGPQRFLIGGTAQSVTLLGKLRRPPQPDFAELLAGCASDRLM